MGATASMFYSRAVEAAAGMAVNGAVSSVASNYELQEELDVTLFKLQQQVIMIESAISEAKRRRIRNLKLLEWLTSLINATYVGNFYHRDFKRRNSYPPMIKSEGTSNLPISTFCHRHKRQRTNIRSLIFGDDELKNLHDVLQKLTSIDICAFIAMVSAYPERPVPIYIYMEPHRLLNRDKQIDDIVKFLLEPSRTRANNVDVLPIIGDDGVGKTSLVFHSCFEKPNVQNHFSMKIYLDSPSIQYIPSGSNAANIFTKILWECCNIRNVIRYNDENTCVAMLKQKLSSERFLLVMDKVYNIDPAVWNILLECLRCGKQGSKVIFIMSTYAYNRKCHNSVKAGTLDPIMVDWFSEEEYSLYFKEHAFGSADPEDFPELIQIGREIEKKMKRSFWGAKLLGEILRDNLNASFWSMFLQEGLSDSNLRNLEIFSICDIMCRLLTKCLDVHNVTMPKKWDGKHQSYEFKSFGSYKFKSFGELMALGATCWTSIKEEKKDGKYYYSLPFLVTKYIVGGEYFALVAHCKLKRKGKIQPTVSVLVRFPYSDLLYG